MMAMGLSNPCYLNERLVVRTQSHHSSLCPFAWALIFAAIAAAAALAAAAAAGFMPPPAPPDAAGIGPENPWLIANARALAIRAAASGSTLGSIIAGAGAGRVAPRPGAFVVTFAGGGTAL